MKKKMTGLTSRLVFVIQLFSKSPLIALVLHLFFPNHTVDENKHHCILHIVVVKPAIV